MSTPTDRNSAGKVLGGRYMLLAPIAQGGMGEVWKARDRETGRMVAAKVLRPEFSGEELSLSRLRTEARNAMRIEHPNIASVLDSGDDDGRGWIVMELVDGRPLTDYLRGGARIAVGDLIPVLIQVAMALGAAQSAGVVHRDIKPANILVRADGMVKLTDFGISRTVDQATLTAAGMVMGTAQYLAPEQAMGETATSSGDLYALGIIAYEAVAGHRPFTGATQVDIAFAHVNDQVPPLPEDVPEPFAAVVLHLVEKDPRNRPESGAALVRELVSAAHTLGLPVAPHPLPVPEGEATSAPTAEHPVVPPVAHTPRRTLPEDLLAPVVIDEGGPAPVVGGDWAGSRPTPGRHARHAAPPAPEGAPPAPGASAPPAPVGPVPGAGALPAPSQAVPGGGPGPRAGEDPKERMRRELSERLHRRAEERGARDARPAPAGPAAPVSRSAGPAAPTVRPAAPAAATRPRPGVGTTAVVRTPIARRTPSTASPSSRGTATGAPWRSVALRTVAATQPGAGDPPAPTRWNRSVVAPPVPLRDRIGKWVVITLIVVTVALIVGATILNRFGSLTSLLGSGAHVIEEVRTWSTPWPTV